MVPLYATYWFTCHMALPALVISKWLMLATARLRPDNTLFSCHLPPCDRRLFISWDLSEGLLLVPGPCELITHSEDKFCAETNNPCQKQDFHIVGYLLLFSLAEVNIGIYTNSWCWYLGPFGKVVINVRNLSVCIQFEKHLRAAPAGWPQQSNLAL